MTYDVHNPPMMQCGHAANSVVVGQDGERAPACVICAGINPGAHMIAADAPDLTGRVATCIYCSSEIPSTEQGAFFRHRPDMEKDSFYCGCRGWD